MMDRPSDTREGRTPPSRASIRLAASHFVRSAVETPFGRMDGVSGLELDKRVSGMGYLQARDRDSSSPVSSLLCFIRSS